MNWFMKRRIRKNAIPSLERFAAVMRTKGFHVDMRPHWLIPHAGEWAFTVRIKNALAHKFYPSNARNQGLTPQGETDAK